jgi:hypothetical protein
MAQRTTLSHVRFPDLASPFVSPDKLKHSLTRRFLARSVCQFDQL